MAYTESKLCDVLLAFALARRIRLIRSIRRDADADAEMSFCLIDHELEVVRRLQTVDSPDAKFTIMHCAAAVADRLRVTPIQGGRT